MLHILQSINAEHNQTNPTEAKLPQNEAQHTTNKPCQDTTFVAQHCLCLESQETTCQWYFLTVLHASNSGSTLTSQLHFIDWIILGM